jgi:hypothetical protein
MATSLNNLQTADTTSRKAAETLRCFCVDDLATFAVRHSRQANRNTKWLSLLQQSAKRDSGKTASWHQTVNIHLAHSCRIPSLPSWIIHYFVPSLSASKMPVLKNKHAAKFCLYWFVFRVQITCPTRCMLLVVTSLTIGFTRQHG